LVLGVAAFGFVGSQAIAAPASSLPAADGYGTDSWWYQAMGLTEAHKISTGRGVTIAVIDGPVDLNVPELKGQGVKAVKSFCSNKPTATGKIADHGTRSAVFLVGNGRGTAPGGLGVAGIAPDATVRTYSVDDSPTEGLQCASGDPLAEAIDTAVRDGAQVLSMSLGVEKPSKELEAVVQKALLNDVVVVAAAGNAPEAKTVSYPAAYPGVVAVAAVDRNAKPWDRNVPGNREAFVISAAGVDVKTGAFDGNKWRSGSGAPGRGRAGFGACQVPGSFRQPGDPEPDPQPGWHSHLRQGPRYRLRDHVGPQDARVRPGAVAGRQPAGRGFHARAGCLGPRGPGGRFSGVRVREIR
jgi:subtilisin family serine protease